MSTKKKKISHIDNTKLEEPSTEVRTPWYAAYDEVLTRVYGDWRTPIKGASEHEIVAFDAKMPWRRYLQLQTEC